MPLMPALGVDIQLLSSRSAVVSWRAISSLHIDSYQITVKDVSVFSGEMFLLAAPDCTRMELPGKLSPGHRYSVTVDAMVMDCSHSIVVYKIVAKGRATFRAVFTMEEMRALYGRAIEFVNARYGHPQPIEWLYRNKQPQYLAHVSRNRNVMEAYLKDNSGDRACPLNGEVRGLFFGCQVDNDTGKPPTKSRYGPCRFLMPASMLANTATNLYFADFYCAYHAHYVTIVITRTGSEADKFCREHLVKLNPQNNPFMWKTIVQPPFSWMPLMMKINVTTKVWVELFYTEDIDLAHHINKGAWFDEVEWTGQYPRNGGIPKNKHCKVCNLYEYEEDETSVETSDSDNAEPDNMIELVSQSSTL